MTLSPSRKALLIVGHGSRDSEGVLECEAFNAALATQLQNMDCGLGFLEFAQPTIKEAVVTLHEKGNQELFVVPCMLTTAGHVKNDIPLQLEQINMLYPQLKLCYGRDLGIQAGMIRAAADRIREAMLAQGQHDFSDTMLLVVGRGASDPHANAQVCKLTRILWEGLGFAWAETCYSGSTEPLVANALPRVAKLGFQQIVVFPYFLFTGILIKRIYQATDDFAKLHPDINIIKAPYLNDHNGVFEAIKARVTEAIDGSGNMNCQLCVYREALPGFEERVGEQRQGHHHHH